jgi:hypothetical protein
MPPILDWSELSRTSQEGSLSRKAVLPIRDEGHRSPMGDFRTQNHDFCRTPGLGFRALLTGKSSDMHLTLCLVSIRGHNVLIRPCGMSARISPSPHLRCLPDQAKGRRRALPPEPRAHEVVPGGKRPAGRLPLGGACSGRVSSMRGNASRTSILLIPPGAWGSR